jgi:hypothetical protein
MDSVGENVGVYSEAKGEYTRQLCQFIVPALLTYFLETMDEVKLKDSNAGKLLWNFQNTLKEVPEWNIDKVKRETTRIQELAKCDYLEELLTAVFIAHTKVLSAIRLTSKQKKLQISIPKLEHFLHRTIADCARLLWSNVYLFSPSGAAVERQKNLHTVEGLLNEGILQTIRTMLPVKSILREYLHEDAEEEEEEAKPEPVVEEAKPEVKEEVKPEVKEEAKTEVKEEAKPEVKEEAKPEVKEEAKPEPVVVEEAKEEAPAPPPTIVVDTEPSVRFTNIDTVFDMQEVNTIDNEMGEGMMDFVDSASSGLDGTEDYEEL